MGWHMQTWLLSWQQWLVNTNKMCAYWQMRINHQQKATSVLNVEEFINLPLFKATVSTRNRMANSYSISCRTQKWMKKLFFNLLDIILSNSYINLTFLWWPNKPSKILFEFTLNLFEMSARILDLNQAQEDNQTNKPIKWLILMLNTIDIGQLQDCRLDYTCSTVSVQERTVLDVWSKLVYRFMFSYFPHKSIILHQCSPAMLEENHVLKFW